MIKGIHHASLLVEDLEVSIRFYSDVLELPTSSKRPNLDFDGAWFEAGSQQLHLITADTTNTSNNLAQRCGRDRHIAFSVDNIDALKNKLNAAGVKFETSKSGRMAIFCRDPDGNALEFIGQS